MTAMRKLMPERSSLNPYVRRRPPELVSIPTAAKREAKAHGDDGFDGDAAPSPTKLANARKYTAKYSGELNRSAKFATHPDRTVIRITPTSAPNPAERNARVEASAAFPALAIL